MLILFVANSFVVRDIFINDSGGLPLIKTYRLIDYHTLFNLYTSVLHSNPFTGVIHKRNLHSNYK